MSGITSHVLDTSIGKPARGIVVVLEWMVDQQWKEIGRSMTNDDGRCPELIKGPITVGKYRIHFLVEDYFKKQDVAAFYPAVRIEFNVADDEQHYHVPLLLNPYGYSTYRGS